MKKDMIIYALNAGILGRVIQSIVNVENVKVLNWM
jgi:hypothetical protein